MKNILLSVVLACATCVSLSLNANTDDQTAQAKAVITETEMLLKQLEVIADDACAKTRQACQDCNSCEDTLEKCTEIAAEGSSAE